MSTAAPWAFQALARVLAARAGGAALPAAPDWIDPSAIESISLALPGPRQGWRLDVALRDGIGARGLPAQWNAGGGPPLPLRCVRAARAQAQCAPAVRRLGTPLLEGTATALVRDTLAPDRNYLLTCGHVAAPNPAVRHDEALAVDCPGAGDIEARLAEWQPALGGIAYRTNLDAALLEVWPDDALRLRSTATLTPTGLAAPPRADQPVTLRRRATPLPGSLQIHWSGWVDLPGLTPGVADYFLADAIGYAAAERTTGGDSGAALWDSEERLLGMHIGAIPDAEPGSANAVLGLIRPVLDWFAVLPYLRHDPATLPAERVPRRVAPHPPPDPSRDDTITIVAKTLWGEARGEGDEGMRAVACVIQNRVINKVRGTDEVSVCLANKQFSCWNAGDPNLVRMEAVARAPDAAFRRAREIATELINGRLPDITRGATHYHAATMRQPPAWARGHEPCAVIGNHRFFKHIR